MSKNNSAAVKIYIVFLIVFPSIFLEKSMKKQWKKRCVFSHRRLFFSTWRPSRNTVFYNTKATFSFFEFLWFLPKNIGKTTPKCWRQVSSQKSPQNGPRGAILGPKMLPNSRQRQPKLQKLTKKVVFGHGNFSIDFFTEKNATFLQSRSNQGQCPFVGPSAQCPIGEFFW